MNYEKSAICRSHRYCDVCRRKSKQGQAYRRSIGQMSNEASEDFECPVNLPWLPENPGVEELLAFSRLVDDKLINQFTSPNPVIRVSLDRNNLNLLFKRYNDVKEIFGETHGVYKAMSQIIAAKNNTTGCTGCMMNRLLRGLSMAIDKCTQEEKKKIVELLNKSIII